jgi:hypothetical protein
MADRSASYAQWAIWAIVFFDFENIVYDEKI